MAPVDAALFNLNSTSVGWIMRPRLTETSGWSDVRIQPTAWHMIIQLGTPSVQGSIGRWGHLRFHCDRVDAGAKWTATVLCLHALQVKFDLNTRRTSGRDRTD